MGKEADYYDRAEALYVSGKTMAQIAELFPVSEKTLYEWSKKGDWPRRRAAHLASRRNVADILRDRLQDKMAGLTGCMTAADVDEISKITASIDRIERGAMDIKSAAVEVMERWVRYLRSRGLNPEEMLAAADRVQGFFEWLEMNG